MKILNIINKSNKGELDVKSKRNKIKNRVISVVLSTAILTNSIPLASVFEFFNIPAWHSASEMLNASADYSPSSELGESAFSLNPEIDSAEKLSAYCYHYQNSTEFASAHANDVITLTAAVLFDENYLGIGTEANPFGGTIKYPSTTFEKNTDRAIFCYATDSVQFRDYNNDPCKLVLKRVSVIGESESKPVFADHVVYGRGSGNWDIELEAGSSSFSGVIGEIGAGAHVDLTFTNNAGTDIIFNGTDIADAGAICGKMGENSELKLTYTGSFPNVTSAHGSAGGLVGSMESGAALRLSAAPESYAPTVTASDGYAGGIVGYMAASAEITDNEDTPSALNITVGAVNVKGSAGAGGLYGHYVFNSNQTSIDLTNTTIDVTNARVGGDGFCGTLYGVLETSYDLTITSNNTAVTCSSKDSGNGCFGGVIGKLVTSSLSQTISIDNLKISPTGNTAFSSFGGVIGCVDSAEGTASYVQVNNVEVSAAVAANTTSFGGVIGDTSVSNGVFVDLGDFTLTTTGGVKGGGVVGTFNNGVLRLSGTTDLSGASFASAENCGQLVGKNNNVLVYALGNGSDANWTFKRPSSAAVDDLGTWGEVVRTVSGGNLEDAGIVTVSAGHAVTLAAPASSISNTSDFAKTALNMMLNRDNTYGGLFSFGGSDALNAALTVSADIDLAGTGFIGFMRDGSDDMGTFSGSIGGNSKVIKLAVGEAYGLKSDGTAVASTDEGVGQIYRHKNIGLFSVLGNTDENGTATVSALTVAGAMNIRNKSAEMNIGGIAAQNGGNVTFTGVTVGGTGSNTLTINYNEGASISGVEAKGKNIGGLIGLVGTSGTVSVSGANSSVGAALNMTGSKGNWTSYGGAVGKVTAPSFTIDIGDSSNKLTIKMNADVSGLTSVGANSDCGGLIGNITNAGSYGARTVNINKLDFNGCTIGNAASTNGGGLLGYSWLNTTANISGMTVTSATINNRIANNASGGNSNFGAMCYSATGKWKVDSLTVTSLTVSGGAGSSIGMLVNKAYTANGTKSDGSTNYTGGLYLDVLASGYILTSASLPSTSKYDELAAYSAQDSDDILTGGAGIISVNMDARKAEGETPNPRIADYTVGSTTTTGTGTYTNKLSDYASTVNNTSRYYYNLDVMSSSDDAQNLLLWSAKKYAHSSLNSEFDTTLTTTLSGTADMTGLSFYPIAKADGLAINGLDLTLDYDGIYAKTGAGMDPGATVVTSGNTTTDNRNQHYLMHSGLFIDLSTDSTLTISGGLTLRGEFLETGNYKGVLISDTMRGNLICKNGSITLAGVTPYTIGGTAYTDGFMLINNIKRDSTLVDAPDLKLYNVSTSGYTAGTAVAKSLIGPSTGSGLKMEFSKIKLHGDTANKIFSQATLVDSIKSDTNAQLIYNFTYDDDWENENHNVTYGYEISGSVQYLNREKKYSSGPDADDPKRWYVRADSAPTDATTDATDFSSGYLPYVRQPYVNNTPDANGLYYCELMVNVESDGLTSGCGTYNDPYQITLAAELQSVAKFLKDGASSDLKKITLPKTKAHLTSGDRWCDGKADHADYTYNKDYDEFISSTVGTDTWSVEEVQQYLAASYYTVTSLTLDNEFVGLGGTTANTAFRGVIVGANDSVTIENESTNPFIKVSNGCVVKNINVKVKRDLSLTQDAVSYTENKITKYYTFDYDYTTANLHPFSFYGGIIGEIMGGDNIIDNSYIKYDAHTITLSGDKGTTIPVGGYVGVVVYGGLIFKNMTAVDTVGEDTVLRANNSGLTVYYGEYTDNNLASNTEAAKAAIYVNPLVGRVINGYAVNETETSSSKHTLGRFTISEDGHYHDDDNTERFTLPEKSAAIPSVNAADSDISALIAKVEALEANPNTATPLTDAEKALYAELSLLHTLKNGKKHYPIADINKSETKMLDVKSVPANATTDGAIEAPNAQAMFILSLITQSTAGTATDAALGTYANSLAYGTYKENNVDTVHGMSHNAEYSDVGKADDPNTPDVDESAIVPDDYINFASLDSADNSAKGSSPIPYIVQHYTECGEKVESETVTSVLTTVYHETRTTVATETVTETLAGNYVYSESSFTGTVDDLNGQTLVINNKRDNQSRYIQLSNTGTSGRIAQNNPTELSQATEIHFVKQSNGKFHLSGYNNGTLYYLKIKVTSSNAGQGGLELRTSETDASDFTIEKTSDDNGEFWIIYDESAVDKDGHPLFINNDNDQNKKVRAYKQNGNMVDYDAGNRLQLFRRYYGPPTATSIVTVVSTYTATSVSSYVSSYTTTAVVRDYPARCVASINGYYDINLTGKTEYKTGESDLEEYTYQLPDSFRGLGCVGIYDYFATNSGRDNKYSIKLDKFDGKGCTIDADIYLNKFKTDNYFDVLHAGGTQSIAEDTQIYQGNGKGGEGLSFCHGIGLFDSVIMKSASSEIGYFTLTGSVNTEIYNNDYANESKEWNGVTNETSRVLWLSSGGVCGWSTNGVYANFTEIALNDLTVNGSGLVGGLLGFSGIGSTNVKVIIKQCSADNISLKMSSANNMSNSKQARNGMGAFVGKVQEGAVVIYGTEHDYSIKEGVQDTNDDLTKYSEVKIKSFGFADDLEYYTSTGGLVGFAGHCCQAYDMKITSSDETVTIGSALVRFSGGIVGGMQSFNASTTEKTCLAYFKNCTVENLDVEGEYAGGFYGGKWDSEWTPYTITLDNCKMVGKSTHNHIAASKLNDNACAGGFIGRGLVKTSAEAGDSNILIKDCIVSNYDITASNSGNYAGYAGGFIGYCSSNAGSSTITCYIHDSSVENSKIGASGAKSYGGGAIGWIAPKETTLENKMLGYNIKLDHVTTDSGANMGAWVGYLNPGKTTIQFTGMAIYGEGFSKNIGGQPNSGVSLKDSFVYADYTGQSYGDTTTPRMSVSGTDVFTLDAETKTILRTVSQTVTADGKTEDRMQVYKYSYSDEPVVSDTNVSDGWTIDGSGAHITRINSGKQYVYAVTLEDNEIYSLTASDKIITRQIINGGSTHTIRYNYTEVPTGTTLTVNSSGEALSAIELADKWSIDETDGTITRISSGMKYVYTIAVSGLNKGDVVPMPKYPFVNVNPQSKLGSDEVLSGDGAVLYSLDANPTYPADNTMAAKIYADINNTDENSENYSRRYTTFADDVIFAGKTIEDYLKPENDIGDRISTFRQESPVELQDNVDDFAVVVIATGEEDETTNLINRYIQLVTNTSTDYAAGSDDGYFTVDIKTCKYENGSFDIVDTNNHGLTNSGGKFRLNNSYVDSKEGTFTLLDVQFKDPFDTSASPKTAYHLYVPVYTVREMEVKYYAVAKTGAYAASNKTNGNSYAALMAQTWDNNEFKHVDSLDTWMTHYIRYEYDTEDIEALLNQGKIRWNYKKPLDFETVAGGFNRLPGEHGNDTYMVLVDPNANKDNVYYACISDMRSVLSENNDLSWEVDLTRFKTPDDLTSFSFPSINTLIGDKIEAVEKNSNDGRYNKLDPSIQADAAKISAGQYEVSIVTDSGTDYYDFTSNNDGGYDIKLKDNVTDIYEDYYISIKVPRPKAYAAGVDKDGNAYPAYSGYTNELYYYRVNPQSRLSNDANNIVNENGFSSVIKPASLTKTLGCKIMIAEAYDQTLREMTVEPPNQQITANNRKITVDLWTDIILKNKNALDCLNASEFFQSFYITLDRKIGETIENDIPASAISSINAYYNIGSAPEFNAETGALTNGYPCTDVTIGSNYINVQTFPGDNTAPGSLVQGQQTSSELFELLKQDNGSTAVYAHIEITFTEEHLPDEFPESTEEERNGVNVNAASNLGYDADTLSRSSMTKKYPPDSKYYYIMDSKSATLRYVAKANDIDAYDEIGYKSDNRSTLGVNGLSVDDPERTNMLDGTGYMPVNTQAYYHVSELPDLDTARKLKLTLTLKKKQNDRTYSDINDIQNYLDGDVSFKLGETNVNSAASGNVITAVFDVSETDFTMDYVDVLITFNAKSGDNFHAYANYEAYLTAELFTDEECAANKNVPNSFATNYIIYTNAKINPEFLSQASNE